MSVTEYAIERPTRPLMDALRRGELVDLSERQAAALVSMAHLTSPKLAAARNSCVVRYNRGAVVIAAAGQVQARDGWSTKVETRSPRYTTRLDELPVVAA